MRHEFCGSELRKRATAAVTFLGQAGGVHVDARAREQRVTGRPRREGGRGRATGEREPGGVRARRPACSSRGRVI